MSRGYETASSDIYELLKQHARDNRHEMTKSEEVLWNALRHEIQGYRFRRQHAIGDYIVDFVCLSKKIVIEVDGGYHIRKQQIESDSIRTAYLENKGFHVIRFSNEEVNTNISGIIQTIKEELNKKEE